MVKTLRPGDVLRAPDGIIGELAPTPRVRREEALAQIPKSWRTVLARADEWPFPDPDTMLVTATDSFADYPTEPEDLPAEIVPFSDFEPWGKMEEETNRDYELFSHYRALGLSRTFAAVAKHFSISQTYVSKVAHKHGWLDRVDEWDKYREKVYTSEILDKTKKMAEEHAKISAKGVRALSIAFDELLERIDSEDPLHLEEMSQLSLKSLYAMVEKAARVLPNLMNAERLSRGLPTELSTHMVVREDRIVLQTTDDLINVVEGLGLIMQNSLPEPEEIIEVEGEEIEEAELVD